MSNVCTLFGPWKEVQANNNNYVLSEGHVNGSIHGYWARWGCITRYIVLFLICGPHKFICQYCVYLCFDKFFANSNKLASIVIIKSAVMLLGDLGLTSGMEGGSESRLDSVGSASEER